MSRLARLAARPISARPDAIFLTASNPARNAALAAVTPTAMVVMLGVIEAAAAPRFDSESFALVATSEIAPSPRCAAELAASMARE